MAAITDNFTDAANTLLESHVSPGGQTWSKLSAAPQGTLSLGANRIDTASVVGGNPIYLWNLPAISSNITFSADYVLPLASPNDFYFSLTTRGSTSGGSFFGYIGIVGRIGGVLKLSINRDGSALVANTFPALDDGLVHTLTLVVSGTIIQLFVDGVKKLEAADGNYTTQGQSRVNVHTPSVGSLPAGFYIDNLSIDVGPAPAAPPPPPPLYSGQLYPRATGVLKLPHPDNPPSLPTSFDEEFIGPLNAKWTPVAPTAPVTYDVDSSWPSWWHVWARSLSALPNTYAKLKQTITGFAASTAFSCTVKGSNGGAASSAFFGFRIERLTDGSASNDYVELDCQVSGTQQFVFNHKRVAGVDTFAISSVTLPAGCGDVFLHLQRDTSNVWAFWWSLNGRGWRKITDVTLSFSIGEVLLMAGPNGQTTPDGEFGIDWFRVNWLTL
jgi:hypothetical protein